MFHLFAACWALTVPCQAPLPPLPAVPCPADTAPKVKQVGGGGVGFGPFSLSLPGYASLTCEPLPKPAPKK